MKKESEFDFEFETTKDGFNILKVHKQDKKIYIGSKYRMKDKINEFVISYDEENIEDNVFIVFGIGSGECLKELYKRYPKSKMVIYEPNVKLIEYIKKNPNKYSFLKNEKVYLIDIKKCSIYDALKSIIYQCDINKIKFKYLLNYDKVYDKEILEFKKIVKEFLNDMVFNINTSMLFSETWFNTLTNNLKYIITSKPIDLYRNKYKNIPAIIVSAGPSLNKNIDELSKLNKDMIILSGGRTLRSLLEKNIQPDLIGVVDPGEISYKLVDGYIDKCKSPLLFYEGTNQEVVRKHEGNKIFFTQSNLVTKIFNKEVFNLSVGGSIAHTLTMAAIVMGCNPIIFIGQDLAYTEEKIHADIAINQFSNVKNNIIQSKEDGIYVEDINGNKVRTSGVLDSFKRELENIIKKHSDKTVFINSTEGGAKINGTVQMTLENAIQKYRIKNPINYFKDDINDNDNSSARKNVIKYLKEAIESSVFIKNKSRKALRIVDDLNTYLIIKDNLKINKSVKALDKIDIEIKNKYKNLEILNKLLYPMIYSILGDNSKIGQKQIIEKNKYLYNSILQKINYALPTIENTLAEIENMKC